MTADEKLDLLIKEVSDIRTDMLDMKTDVDYMKSEMSGMKADIEDMKQSIEILHRSAAVVEGDIAPKIQILLENHTDLAENVDVAKNVDNRVHRLEFEVKVIKGVIEAMQKRMV